MLYPKNQSEHLDDALFQNPTSEYRGAPLWSWNDRLDEGTVRKQARMFKDLGLGGFTTHVRVGLDTPYMGPEFMQMMCAANEEAKRQGQLHWLYDEDTYPSGFCGGQVTENPDYCQRQLLFTAFREPDAIDYPEDGHLIHDRYYRLAAYRVILQDGFLKGYERVGLDEEADWYAYLFLMPKTAWYNNQSYVNTLDKKSMRRFIELTHEVYAAYLGDEFSKSIPAIFTDEPQFSEKGTLIDCDEKQRVKIPWTDDLEQTYLKTYGESLLDHLPELFWERRDGVPSVTRYHYHDHVTERFTEAFSDQLGAWCEEHNIALTGHMLEEPTLVQQTRVVGEAMRAYRGFQLPGIDMLCDWREYTTAKQAQSASRQFGRPGVMSEIYGVTNWDFDFRGHKLAGDWQAALGVTNRIHHLTWMSMKGEAKRDYPASIGWQSPWYKQYNTVEDHFARVNTAMTRGKAHVRIAVIHPIESFWLHYGSNEKTGTVRAEMDERFVDLNRWLLTDALDFDYICESLLKDQPHESVRNSDGTVRMQVGEMAYEAILVPNLETIRSSTLDALDDFAHAGGKVIFAGEIPAYVDAIASERPAFLARNCQVIPFVRTRIQQALEPFRDVEIISRSGHTSPMGQCDPGTHTVHLFYQLRDDGDDKWLFIAQAGKMADPDQPKQEEIEIRVKGAYDVMLYDTMTGDIKAVPHIAMESQTKLRVEIYEHDSLLLKLTQAKQSGGETSLIRLHPEASGALIRLPDLVPVTLEEENVLVLDEPVYRADDEPWHEPEEILRLDDAYHLQFGWAKRDNGQAQPYTMRRDIVPEHTIALRYTFEARCDLDQVSLALEEKAITTVILDGAEIETSRDEGYYVDPCIERISLPLIKAGEHTIELTLPYTERVNLEPIYLLGDFSVWVLGRHVALDAPVREFAFTNLAEQGLPFYGGNVTYHIPLNLKETSVVTVEASQFRAPVWEVNGERSGAFAPYRVEVPLQAGEQTLDLKVYGNRINTFGQIHCAHESLGWKGPNAFRTEGTAWTYEYRLKRTGLLKSPVLYEN